MDLLSVDLSVRDPTRTQILKRDVRRVTAFSSFRGLFDSFSQFEGEFQTFEPFPYFPLPWLK